MFARVSTYHGSDADGILDGFRAVTPALEQMSGFSHAYFLVDRQSGKAMSITMWDSEDALTAGAQQAARLREEGTKAGGASIDSVEHFEVGLKVGTPTRA